MSRDYPRPGWQIEGECPPTVRKRLEALLKEQDEIERRLDAIEREIADLARTFKLSIGMRFDYA